MITLAWPWALAALPLPFLAWWLLPRARREEAALHVPFYELASGYESAALQERRSLLRRLLMVLVWVLLVVACARPQWIGDPIQLPSTGRDLMLAVDISGSMGTHDMQLNNRPATRLAAVKKVVGEFVQRRKGDRLGLILFGTRPYVQTPLTFDRTTVRKLLEETPLGIAGGKTAIGDAIGLAVKRLKSRP
ncbi:MAG TPA: VWA domain-containing protein, partial [Pseudomonadales bacterium]|nr:VWA domain-containing protein [Pseudomonadales bacterium]